MKTSLRWLVPSSQKLVAFLQHQLGGEHSGKSLRKAMEANLCRVNGRVERFGSSTVERGDVVELAPSWKSILSPNLSGFETLYEDSFLKIVNKPAGWVCEAQEALRSFGPGWHLVHRLDKDTTGLLLVAKGTASKNRFMELFEQRSISKTYLALVDGIPSEMRGTRQSLLRKKGTFQGQTIWGSGLNGLTAITHWKVLAKGKSASLLECEPETGRTHQIRVHLSEMGHPILVDRQYAKQFRCPLFISRPLLHAYRLQFSHPFLEKEIDLIAPLPVDIRECLLQLGMQMGQTGELAGKKQQDHAGNECHGDEQAEEIEQSPHIVHQTC
jgi:23S rRNA pseudouridine955/2504/2580 synthase